MTGAATPAGDGPVLGILGAGKLGITLARRAAAAGLDVRVATSRPASAIALVVEVVAPGATAMDAADLVAASDVVVLAMPLSRARGLDPALLDGRLVVDAMNFWAEVDGDDEELAHPVPSSSEMVQRWFPGARIVKAFNHVGYHDLADLGAPAGDPGRRAIAVAGDDPDDVAAVAAIVERVGFDALPLGSLATGRALEPGNPAFGANPPMDELRALVAG